jgi:hypothetical protein
MLVLETPHSLLLCVIVDGGELVEEYNVQTGELLGKTVSGTEREACIMMHSHTQLHYDYHFSESLHLKRQCRIGTNWQVYVTTFLSSRSKT